MSHLAHAGVLMTAGGLVCWHAHRLPVAAARLRNEQATWAWLKIGLGLLGVALAGEGVVAIAHGALPRGAPGMVLMIVTIGSCGFFYQGLIEWNDFRTYAADPGDWLNVVCAVLVLVAGGMLVTDLTGARIGRWPEGGTELWLAQLGLLVVLAGTGASVAVLAGLAREPRIWAITAASVLGLVAILVAGITGGERSAALAVQVSWAAIALTVLTASGLAAVTPTARVVTSHATTAGALTVLLSGVAVLTAAGAVEGRTSLATLIVAATAIVGSAIRMVFVYRELAELAESRAAARTDELTGIANRRGLTLALREAIRSPHGRSLLVIDLDRFKEVNDRFGHAFGDVVLQAMTRGLQEALPDDGILSRLGGDEFAVLLTGAGSAQAEDVGNALFAVASQPRLIGGRPIRMSASIGVAVGGDTVTDGELLRRADTAMYIAKRAGGGVSTFDSEVDERSLAEQVRLDELRVILKPGATPDPAQIVAFFQPQVDVQSGAVVGAEALVRWNHPRLGLLLPERFLGVVERNGLMAELTAQVLDQSVRAAKAWHRHGHQLTVSVNLSTSCLVHPQLLPVIDDCLNRHHLASDRLIIEITETSLMRDPDLALQATRQIAERGIGVSIDDYGTGYSSLSYLNDLPATELKLDRSFTARVNTDPRTASIVAGTIDLAHQLGLQVVAEGTEDQPTMSALRRLRCDITQGYLHARPQSGEAFLNWLGTTAVARPARPRARGLATQMIAMPPA